MKSLFEQMGDTYRREGDYLIPNLALPDTGDNQIGKYGRMRRRYLKKHRRILYTNLLTSGNLRCHLAEIDQACNERMESIVSAMAKQEGYTYQPSQETYWKQGFGSETDYIYTTTQFLTVELLAAIHETMAEDESLLICCTSFQRECKSAFSNISIKKIPQMLLGRCEFGKDDYSLNIIEVPEVDVEEEETEE